jgi:GT2 family glycosyltransferase
VTYPLTTQALVSIIIPNKNHRGDLEKCVRSIFERTTYPNYEIVIVDNGSDEEDLLQYYETLRADPRVKLCSLDIPFNYSALNNYAIQYAGGEYYLLLNNDIEIITPSWIEEMLMYVQRDDVAAAGAKLYYPDGTVQHAGVIIGLGGIAGHAFCHYSQKDPGYMGRLGYAQNLSAVTAACMLIKASAYREVGGLDESLAVAFNDVDLCLKLRAAGYLIVWTPYAEAYHYESKSRGLEDTPEKKARFQGEVKQFAAKWGDILEKGDPYYNENLTLMRGDFSVRMPYEVRG